MDRRTFLAAAPVLAGAVTAAARAQQIGVREASANMLSPDKASDPAAPLSNLLARHAVSVRPEQIDAGTFDKAKLRFLDLLGCAFAGARSEGQGALAEVARETAGVADATLIGFPVRTAASQAAMVNAISARAWDFEVMTVVADDRQIESHHAPTTGMVALALAERDRRSGIDFLTAMIVGDDISARVLAATGVDFGKGWSPPPLFATWGGTAIAGRLSGLDADGVRNAFGIAVDQIGGTGQDLWDGVTNWKLAQGAVARNAILSVQLAKAGWTGINDPLLAPFGFYAQFTGGCSRPEYLSRGLGSRFFAEEYFKPYPHCAATHTAIETALDLRREHRIDPARIERIIVRVQPRTFGIFVSKPFSMARSPHTQANYSLTFAVANALRHGSFLLDHYAPAAMREPLLQRLIGAVRIERIGEGKAGLELEIVLRGGGRVTRHRTADPERMPSRGGSTRAQIVDKFRCQAAFSRLVSGSKADAIVARVASLEREADMAAFMRMIADAGEGKAAAH